MKNFYLATDLEFRDVVNELIPLQALRRDKIPTETIIVWFQEFLRLGWKKADFIKAVESAKRAKIFGAIDFTSFLEGERLYTETETERIVNAKINKLIRQGEQILEATKSEIKITGTFQFSENELKAIRAFIFRQVEVYHRGELSRLTEVAIRSFLDAFVSNQIEDFQFSTTLP